MSEVSATPGSFNIGSVLLNSELMAGGSSGKGKSVIGEMADGMRKKYRAKGGLVVDVKAFRERNGSGLKPYEYELSRRSALGLFGELPRGACRSKSLLITDL